MPTRLHRKLARTARKRGYGKARSRRYIYGTMENIKKQRRAKRSRMVRIH